MEEETLKIRFLMLDEGLARALAPVPEFRTGYLMLLDKLPPPLPPPGGPRTGTSPDACRLS
ncbi:MAG: hypothetical protein HY720_11990 [Planctomycetes bacterium]|nr:hypothetical protein [Planctomycetota bacterium]